MDELRGELELQMGRQTLTELIEQLQELNDKPAAFATAAAVDAVHAFEKLVRNHTNFAEEDVVTACSVFSAAAFNAGTELNAEVKYAE